MGLDLMVRLSAFIGLHLTLHSAFRVEQGLWGIPFLEPLCTNRYRLHICPSLEVEGLRGGET